MWSNNYGGPESESGRRVLYKKNFGFFICGFTNSIGSGGFDNYLAKVDELGNLEWEKAYGGEGWEKVHDAALTKDTGVIMVGETSSNFSDNQDIYIVRTDILLCGYLGEKVGWSIGFGLAGVFMLFGMLQFWLSQGIFGDIGLKPKKKGAEEKAADKLAAAAVDRNEVDTIPFSTWQLVMIGLMVIMGLVWILNDPMSKIYDVNVLNFSIMGISGALFTILLAVFMFLFLLVFRLSQYGRITRDKMIAVTFLDSCLW